MFLVTVLYLLNSRKRLKNRGLISVFYETKVHQFDQTEV